MRVCGQRAGLDPNNQRAHGAVCTVHVWCARRACVHIAAFPSKRRRRQLTQRNGRGCSLSASAAASRLLCTARLLAATPQGPSQRVFPWAAATWACQWLVRRARPRLAALLCRKSVITDYRQWCARVMLISAATRLRTPSNQETKGKKTGAVRAHLPGPAEGPSVTAMRAAGCYQQD